MGEDRRRRTATIGITDYAQDSLGDIVYVELPRVGATIAQFGNVGVVESVKAVSDLFTPISAVRYSKSTPRSTDDPAAVNRDPYGAGWLFKLRLSTTRPKLPTFWPPRITKGLTAYDRCTYTRIPNATSQQMLDAVGVASLDELFAVPDALALKSPLDVVPALPEYSIARRFDHFAKKNSGAAYRSLPRCGRLSALRPAGDRGARDARRVSDRVHALSSRSLARLPAGDLRVADLYLLADRDGRSPTRRCTTARPRLPRARSWRSTRPDAARRCSSRGRCIRTTAPCCARTATGSTWTVDELPYARRRNDRLGRARRRCSPTSEYAAVVVQSPNFFGDVDVAVRTRRRRGRATRLRCRSASSPKRSRSRRWRRPRRGAPKSSSAKRRSFGVPVAYGGPYVGFIATTKEHLRRIPGRLAGRRVDAAGRTGVRVDAAGARAAHPPRTSDVEHLHEPSALRADRDDLSRADGQDGPARRGRAQPRALARAARRPCRSIDGVSLRFTAPFFNEFVVACAGRRRRACSRALRERRILGGIDLGRFYPELADCILMTATELTTTRRDRTHWPPRSKEIAACPRHAFDRRPSADLRARSGRAREPYLDEGQPLGDVPARRACCATTCRCPTTANSTSCATSRGSRSGRSGSTLGFYPLGSCTMKYNPRVNDAMANLPGFARPASVRARRARAGRARSDVRAGASLSSLFGMAAFSLNPAAGAHAELAALLIAKAYFKRRGETARDNGHRSRHRARHEPGVGGDGRLQGHLAAERRARARRASTRSGQRARPRDGRLHDDQPEHARGCSRITSTRLLPRCTRPAG